MIDPLSIEARRIFFTLKQFSIDFCYSLGSKTGPFFFFFSNLELITVVSFHGDGIFSLVPESRM
jgi:hypothetical protein